MYCAILLASPGLRARPNDLGQTPLHIAASNGLPETLRLLLASGLFDVNHEDALGRTALYVAVQRGTRARSAR
jgi:ankyrin repeat protein